jgi:hypothetical protein
MKLFSIKVQPSRHEGTNNYINQFCFVAIFPVYPGWELTCEC